MSPRESPVGKFALRKMKPRLVVALVAVLAFGYLSAYRPWAAPFAQDNTHYFYYAERVASGTRALAEHFDPKTTLSIFADAALMKLLRVFATDEAAGGASTWRADVTATRAVSLFWWLLTLYGTGILAWRLTRNPRIIFLGLLLLWTLHPVWSNVNMGAQPKLATMALVPWAMLAVSNRRWVMAGCLCACTALTWQPTALLLLMVAGWLAILARGKNLLLFCLGFILPIIPYELYYLFTGQLFLQIEAQLLFPLFVMSVETANGINLREMPQFWSYTLGLRNPFPLLVILGLVFGFGKFAVRFSGERFWGRPFHAHVIYHAGYLALAGFIIIDAQGAGDFFVIAPYMAITGGWFLNTLLQKLRSSIAPNLGLAPMAGVVLYLLLIILQGPLRSVPRVSLEEQVFSAYILAGVAEEQDAQIYNIGAVHLLGFTNSTNWSRIDLIFRGMDSYLREKSDSPEWTPAQAGKWPEVLILDRFPPPDMELWIDRYELLTPPLFRHHGPVWYQLRE